MATRDNDKMELVYDGQCPVCTTYCEGLKREKGSENLQLVDARHAGTTMDEINAARLDIDEGMVLKVDGKLYYGTEAILELSKRNKTGGFYGWMNKIFFSNKLMAGIFYPLGKAFRNVLLRVLRIEKIRNLG